jgi:hypothetical protein
MHCRCVIIAVYRDNFDTETLQFDGYFLAQLARAQQNSLCCL